MTPIPNANAAVVFVQEQYLFQYVEDGIEHVKYVSPAAIRAAWSEEAIDSGWLEPDTLRCGVSAKGAWAVRLIRPVQRRTLQFSKATMEDSIAPSLTLRLPPLVLAGINGKYHLWAVKEETVTGGTQLYYAPFPNVYGDEHICFGSNPVPAVSDGGMRRALDLFFESPFTTASVSGKSRRYPEDVRLMLRQHALEAAPDLPFPVDDLMPYRATPTLDQALEMLLRR
ncbi:MAG: prokaryotic E2 ligase family D protein [Pyrinomonadaceae bacterium MAG19_C2-C3]|nr:prokaryotic E2 ligase family D protein [Pyrinomonadaceae bacterium MAG19_C2-C3]